MHYDVPKKKIVRVVPRVLNLERLSRRYIHQGYQNPRFLKLQAFRKVLDYLCRAHRPMKVASEHPYINPGMPGAVIPLAECLSLIEGVVYDYDPYLCLERIDPSSIKKSVGVSGTSGDKHAMTEAIKKIPAITDVLVGDLDTLDNNAVDSIAVAYCSLQRELNHDPSD